MPMLTLLLVLALLVWTGFQQLAMPAVVSASAPATELSAARAMDAPGYANDPTTVIRTCSFEYVHT
jgi:hypothetical protein